MKKSPQSPQQQLSFSFSKLSNSLNKPLGTKLVKSLLLLLIALIFLHFWWSKNGLNTISIDTDMGRDLAEISQLWFHKMVWLGPRLGPGYHASPIYYYVFLPAIFLAPGQIYLFLMWNEIFIWAGLILLWWALSKQLSPPTYPLLGIITLGLSPWWRSLVYHPGNGVTYAPLSLIACAALWLQLPWFVCVLAVGTAIAFHPAAVFLLILVAYEWWRRGHKLLHFVLTPVALAIPWAPQLYFEFITKFYLLRNWFNQPPNGRFYFSPNLANLDHIASLLYLPWWLFAAVWILVGGLLWHKRQQLQRLLGWYSVATLIIIIFCLLNPQPDYYFYALVILIWSVLLFAFYHFKFTRMLLASLTFFYLIIAITTTPVPALRPPSRLTNIAESIAQIESLKNNQPILVVAALSPLTEVPQADDYRYLLKLRGLNVVHPDLSTQAEKMVMIIEQPNFDYEHWSNWQLDQFGPKTLLTSYQIEQAKILIYAKDTTTK